MAAFWSKMRYEIPDMQTLVKSIIVLALAAGHCPLLAGPSEELQVGDTFDIKFGEKYKGWTSRGGGLIQEDHGLAYGIFMKDDRLLIVVTKPITRTARGGFGIEQILHRKEVEVPKGDEYTEEACDYKMQRTAFSYLNNKTGMVTGYIPRKTGIEVLQWAVDWNYCSVP